MLRGWKLITLIALIIIVYIVGILVLSIANLQAPSQKRMRNSRFVTDSDIGHSPEILLRRSPIQQLQWCTELKFMDQSSQKALNSYRKAFHEKARSADRIKHKYEHDSIISNKEQKTKKKEVTDSSTISDKNEFSDNENKVIALASFPGSGNTWLRYLLQQATGIYTGSVYKDYGLLKSGFPAESISNSSVLIVKTHEFGSSSWTRFRKSVLLVRDPAKAILAEFNRQSGGHIGFASPDRYKRTNGRYWLKFVTNKLHAWEQTNLSWATNFTGDVLIIYYENLVDNVEKTLRDILNFIEFPTNEDLLACALKRKEGIYRRKKRLLNFDPYTMIMKKMIEKKRIEVYDMLGRNKLKYSSL
ncbi:unnamed protein product [Chironomus riparius]|uniref:WSCD family member AGAP003962 n=1 Tax=Chironomus riparius TaxID=315576 RepID=A0A9N9WQ67_9DIPT|nr:unnamed protein product [Chironomus riparius]